MKFANFFPSVFEAKGATSPRHTIQCTMNPLTLVDKCIAWGAPSPWHTIQCTGNPLTLVDKVETPGRRSTLCTEPKQNLIGCSQRECLTWKFKQRQGCAIW